MFSHIHRNNSSIRRCSPCNSYHCRLAIESLEHRCMLAAAIGYFEEVGTSAATQTEAYASVPTEIDQDWLNAETLPHESTQTALALADDENGRVQATGQVLAKSPEDVKNNAVGPNGVRIPITAAGFTSFLDAENEAYGRVGRDYPLHISSQANGTYEYHAPVGYTGDLVFRGFINLSVNGFEDADPGVVYDVFQQFSGSISGNGGYAVTATHFSDYSIPNETWNIDGNGNVPGLPQEREQGWFYTVPVEIPITDGMLLYLGSGYRGDMQVETDPGEEATLTWTGSASVWGYVTAVGTTLTPGDFNADGNVDADDYRLWVDGSPLADADLDGQISDDDYDIWFANTTEFVVSTIADEIDTNYSFGDLSLREALALAADGNHAGPNAISFASSLFESGPATITLSYDGADSGTIPDELLINSDVTIQGPGTELLTISGNSLTRVFNVGSGVSATLSGMTITGGEVISTSDGGGISNSGTLNLTDVRVYDNYAGDSGGGIYNTGDLTIIDSTIEGNQAGRGGGIFSGVSGGSELTISGSAILSNSTFYALPGHNYGGGLYVYTYSPTYATASITNSTFSGNTAQFGAAVIVNGPATVEFVNSTITANSATQTAGGIFYSSATTAGIVTLHNTILADNTANTAAKNVYGTLDTSSSYNLLGLGTTGGLSHGTNGNIVLTSGTAGLTALGDYGGPTMTHALLSTSPALDAGSDMIVTTILFDQRGEDRTVDIPSVGGSEQVDIGAFEAGNTNTLIVTIDDDESDGNLAANDLSLREALALSTSILGADVIRFDRSLHATGPATIALAYDGADSGTVPDELAISGDVTIDGPGADLLTVSGADVTRVFNVSSSAVAAINGIRIKDGSADNGAGIYSEGTLSLDAVQIEENGATYSGGGIYRAAGDLLITNSTIVTNWASTGGGMYYASTDDTTVINSTISSNVAWYYGGGIYDASSGTDKVINSTVTENIAAFQSAGGIRVGNGLELHNSIVAGNEASNNPGAKDVWGTFTSGSSYNLIGYDTNTSNNLEHNDNHNIVGVSSEIDARLAALGNYGGPTQTHALLFNSPAIDAGDGAKTVAFDLLLDQRGNARVDDGNDDDLALVDIGAFELAADEHFGGP
jgi:hypothetical protein